MKGRKWISESKILGRCFHADVFESKTEPKGLVLWFGAPGKTKDGYDEREKGVVPIFREAWDRLGEDLPIIFVFVSGPYDIEIAKFSKFTADKDRWNQHVEKDVLGNWPDLPVYLIGNSGGAALAFNGIHKSQRVVGAGGLGAAQGKPAHASPQRASGQDRPVPPLVGHGAARLPPKPLLPAQLPAYAGGRAGTLPRLRPRLVARVLGIHPPEAALRCG